MLSFKSREFWLVLLVLVAAGLLANFVRFSQVKPKQSPHLENIPFLLSDWTGQELYFTQSSLEVLNADTTLLRVYKNQRGQEASLFIAYFNSQKYGSQIHSPKHCLPGGGWNIMVREKEEFQLQDGEKVPFNRMLISDGRESQLMYYCFLTRGGILTNEFMLKADLVLNSVLRRPTDAAIIRIIFPLPKSGIQQQERRLANEFLALFWPQIKQALPFHS